MFIEIIGFPYYEAPLGAKSIPLLKELKIRAIESWL
jgi:hypothetical protein